MLFLSFLALLPRLLLGLCIVHAIWDSLDKQHLLIKIFLAAAIGFGISSIFFFLWIWIGLPALIYAILETICAVLFSAWMIYQNRARFSSTVRFSLIPEKSNIPWLLLLAGGILLFVFNLAVFSLQSPHGLTDAWVNWNVVSRVVYLGGSNWQNTFQRQFDHPDYPLSMSLTNVITWLITGKDSTWGPIMLHLLFSLFTAGLLFALVNTLRDFKLAALATVIFMAQPFTVSNGMSQLADLPLSYIILGIGGLTLLYFQTAEKRLAILIGLLAGLSAWLKNEGIFVAGIYSVIWILSGWRNSRAALKNYFIGLALPLVIVILFKVFLAPSNDIVAHGGPSLFQKIFDLQRYVLILKTVGYTVLWQFGDEPPGAAWMLIAYIFIVGKAEKKIPGLWVIGALIVLQLLAYFATYVITPYDLAWHMKTSLTRLCSHVIPLALLWIFAWTKSPHEFITKG